MNIAASQNGKLKLFFNLLVLGISLHGVLRKDYTLDKTTIFERFLIESFAPIQSKSTSLRQRFVLFVENYFLIVDAKKENHQLKKKIADLENMIYHLEETKRENLRLKGLLQFGEEIPHTKILAQVIGWNSASDHQVLRINKGTKDGIKDKSTVVTAEGLVGYIYRSSSHYSDILTILDQNNRVDAIVNRTRSHGIIEGFSNIVVHMKYVTRTEPVEVNDTVMTAGLGNIYPKGLKIGHISKIEKENYGITQLIKVTPSVNFQKLEEVVVLIRSQEKEKLELDSSSGGKG